MVPPMSRTVTNGVPLGLILAGRPHPPVVYFAKLTDGIKIGWTADLVGRMRDMCIPLRYVVLVLPGGQAEEATWHDHFAHYWVRAEVFDIEHLLSDLIPPMQPRRAYRASGRVPRASGTAIQPAVGTWLKDADLLKLAARPQGVSVRESASLLLGTPRHRGITGGRLDQFRLKGWVEPTGPRNAHRLTALGAAALAEMGESP